MSRLVVGNDDSWRQLIGGHKLAADGGVIGEANLAMGPSDK
ncbi:MAG: hypothetical protein JWO62_2025 [Acidimicrobiaceae bacterium]|nr:hypothetical protein [Acidimicrobiaceae bacterium]